MARWYNHIHPALLMGTLYVRFKPLVEDPVPTLSTSLIPLSILQIVYVAICLPPTGSTGAGSASAPAKSAKLGLRRKLAAPRAPYTELRNKVVVRIWDFHFVLGNH